MIVKIEKVPQAYNDPSKNSAMYDLVQMGINSQNIDEFYEKLNKERKSPISTIDEHFKIVSGSDHIWIHERDYYGTGEALRDRLFIITVE